eukprot:GDKH01012474.1.p1 GENE.GDKH01012474.1~~GDKH01012474.1.p1  ORF type:complete len:361 (+),score=27.68 GDKH01012474.1:174-1256(+)
MPKTRSAIAKAMPPMASYSGDGGMAETSSFNAQPENRCQRSHDKLYALKEDADKKWNEYFKDKDDLKHLKREVNKCCTKLKFDEASNLVDGDFSEGDLRLKFNKCDKCGKPIGVHPSEKDLDAQREERKREAKGVVEGEGQGGKRQCVEDIKPCSKMAFKDGVLFPEEGHMFFFGTVEQSKGIHVRKTYEELYDVLWDGWNNGNAKNAFGAGQFYLTGTPGIGKSCFANYVLYRLLQVPNRDFDIICIKGSVVRCINALVPGQKTEEQLPISGISDLVRDRDIVLWDVCQKSEELQQDMRLKRVLFLSSPNGKVDKKMNKAVLLSNWLYMPVPSSEDLIAGRFERLAGDKAKYRRYPGAC